MVDVRPELLDLHSEFKCGVFGVCCLLTLLAFCYVLYRLAVAPCRMPWSELSVVLLSCTQLLFGIFFYFGSQHPFLQIVNKAIKVVQAEIVSWSCLKLVLTNKKQRRRMVGGMLNLVSCGIVATLGYGLFTVYDDTIYLNAKIGIIMSSMWCLMSMTVIYVAYKIRKSIQTTQLTPADELEERDGTVGGSERGGSDLVGCYSKTKYQHLLLLVVVEAVTAMGTWIWDIVLYYSIRQSLNGKGLELDMPGLKELLYVSSNTMLILIPNWTVFYVFYWYVYLRPRLTDCRVQRGNYSTISSNWDVNLNSFKYQPQTFVDDV